MLVIKSIGILSLAKYYAIYMAILGVLLSVILAIVPTKYSTLPIIIFAPGILALIGAITGLVNAILYNGLAASIGGVKFDYEDSTIKDINVVSVAAIYGIINGVWGFVSSSIIGFIIYAVAGFITAAMLILMYNFLSKEIGGIKIMLDKNRLVRIEWLPAAKILAIVMAVGALLAEFLITAIVAVLPKYSQSIAASLIVALGVGLIGVTFALVIGFIFGAFEASFYNILAENITGLELNTAQEDVNPVQPVPSRIAKS